MKKDDKKKQIEIESLKKDLEHKKEVFETYCKVLAEYKIVDMAYASIRYEQMWFDNCKKNPNLFIKSLFNSVGGSEIENLKIAIKETDEAIEMCRNKIQELGLDTKIKIIKTALSQERIAMKSFVDDKLKKELQKENKRLDLK
jgi:hypothetical protein